ncbi:TetR/AcrR family transcriptional regulator [Streptomyces sp. NPDC097619]|uniref:TetR/AcrR family transcriptional regulator n=1 Tax=Streptomyces sp. NPDC097619 TaxID=3157228 RepID=UPI003322676C
MTPLPRFHRLPADRREAFLAAARAEFAAQGPDTASYNRIIESTGVSKTAAYQYFDGREDLLGAVLADVLDRLLGVLGPWRPAGGPEEFWARLAAGAEALAAHLAATPEDLALAEAAVARVGGGAWLGWFGELVDDGRRLGVIRTGVDRDLLVAATAAVLKAADGWALAALAAGAEPPRHQVWELLAALWSSPSAPGREI